MINDMPRKLPKNVYKQRTKHGKVVFYYRIGKGPRTRIHGLPGTPEFDESYMQALTGSQKKITSKHDAKSLGWLVDRYRESARWAGLSDATRKQQGLFFKKMVESAGHADFLEIDHGVVEAAIEERAATPALANNFLKALRGLFQWAVKNRHIETDPTSSVERLKNKSDGFPPWDIEDAIKFCNRWPVGTSARLAFELLLNTGLRRSDIVRAGRQHLRGNVLTIKTRKTGAVVTVELSARVLDVISKTKTGDLHFIVGAVGKPLTVESFGNWFRDCCRAADVEKSAHGIRKMSATIAANAGATTHELMALYGWSTTQQAEVYTKGADRMALGVKTSRKVSEQIEAVFPLTLLPNTPQGKITK